MQMICNVSRNEELSGLASGTTLAPSLAPQAIATISEQKLEEVKAVEQSTMDSKEEEAWSEDVVEAGEGGDEKAEGGEGCDGGVEDNGGEKELERFTFSIDDLQYDGDVKEFSLDGEPVEFAGPELRAQLLAKVKARVGQAAATIPPEGGESCQTGAEVSSEDDELGLREIKVATELSPCPPRPLNLRHQLQRSNILASHSWGGEISWQMDYLDRW